MTAMLLIRIMKEFFEANGFTESEAEKYTLLAVIGSLVLSILLVGFLAWVLR